VTAQNKNFGILIGLIACDQLLAESVGGQINAAVLPQTQKIGNFGIGFCIQLLQERSLVGSFLGKCVFNDRTVLVAVLGIKHDRLSGEIEFAWIDDDVEREKKPVIGYIAYIGGLFLCVLTD